MDADLYAESIEYERLTQAVYQSILAEEGVQGIDVEHNVDIEGRSGVKHQIDVSWRFKRATVSHHVLVECKNYASAITLEKVRNFFAVLHDIGNCQGVMVTKTGYQSGVVRFAKFYGIGLKLLREPTEEDWKDRIKDMVVSLPAIALSTQPGKQPTVRTILGLESQEEADQLKIDLAAGKYEIPEGPEMVFVDENEVPITPELRWWLPQALSGDGHVEGGPYEKTIELPNHHLILTATDGSTRCVKVRGLKVIYHYEVIDTREFTLAGAEIIRAILKDFGTGEIEHMHRNDKGRQEGGDHSAPPSVSP